MGTTPVQRALQRASMQETSPEGPLDADPVQSALTRPSVHRAVVAGSSEEPVQIALNRPSVLKSAAGAPVAASSIQTALHRPSILTSPATSTVEVPTASSAHVPSTLAGHTGEGDDDDGEKVYLVHRAPPRATARAAAMSTRSPTTRPTGVADDSAPEARSAGRSLAARRASLRQLGEISRRHLAPAEATRPPIIRPRVTADASAPEGLSVGQLSCSDTSSMASSALVAAPNVPVQPDHTWIGGRHMSLAEWRLSLGQNAGDKEEENRTVSPLESLETDLKDLRSSTYCGRQSHGMSRSGGGGGRGGSLAGPAAVGAGLGLSSDASRGANASRGGVGRVAFAPEQNGVSFSAAVEPSASRARRFTGLQEHSSGSHGNMAEPSASWAKRIAGLSEQSASSMSAAAEPSGSWARRATGALEQRSGARGVSTQPCGRGRGGGSRRAMGSFLERSASSRRQLGLGEESGGFTQRTATAARRRPPAPGGPLDEQSATGSCTGSPAIVLADLTDASGASWAQREKSRRTRIRI